jgi:hypothetical protein
MRLLAGTPSGTGFQLSVFGLLGILAGIEEGLEVNVLGLTVGVDALDWSLKLPLAGRVNLWWMLLLGPVIAWRVKRARPQS